MNLSIFGGGMGIIYALDASTGKEIWKKEFPSMNVGAATVVNDILFTSTFFTLPYSCQPSHSIILAYTSNQARRLPYLKIFH